jgi:site-specific recombinase XerD
MTRDTAHGAPPARLTRQHFALYRGYLDGVSDTQLHASYGESTGDVRHTRRLIAVLRDTLSVLARRAHDTEAARLLRLRPGSIPIAEESTQTPTPSLDDFRERIDPDGVYGEAELLALYEEEYSLPKSPALDRRAARNARLRRRQADALARMEASLAQEPHLDHPVDGWFEPAIAARLAAAGFSTIGDVIERIETKRHRWYAGVPRLGPKGAQRVVDWLRLHAGALAHTLSERATVPRRQWTAEAVRPEPPVFAVVPLEALAVPASLDGSKGTNRAAAPSPFDSDLHAISAWLDARSASEHTRRTYRREAERLLLWALVEKRKALSSLDDADCAVYIDVFLANPQPVARWIAKGRIERCLATWRPFAGPLSERSRESARAILNAMCEWLVNTHYLASNPFANVDRVAAPPVFESTGRALSVEQWKFVFESTARDTYSFAEHRDRLALLLAYATGLRRAELAAATTDALSVVELPAFPHPVWRLTVGGSRTVLLPAVVVEEMHENFSMRGLPVPLSCADGTPILAQARNGAAISPDGIGKLIKAVFANAANLLEASRSGSGKDLMRASTHWLRHTHSTHALSHGAPLSEVNKGLGHAKLATTSLYLQQDEAGRFLGSETLLRKSLRAQND